MGNSLGVTYHREVHQGDLTEAAVKLKLRKAGYCTVHPDIQLQSYRGGVKAFGKKTIHKQCPECAKNRAANHAANSTAAANGGSKPKSALPTEKKEKGAKDAAEKEREEQEKLVLVVGSSIGAATLLLGFLFAFGGGRKRGTKDGSKLFAEVVGYFVGAVKDTASEIKSLRV